MERTKETAEQIAEQEAAVQKPAEQETAEQESAGPALENDGPEAEAELAEGVLQPYAVAFKGVLRLRQEPRLDAPVLATLPCGAGVFADGEPGPDGWMHVRTGRLSGWMMAEYLEALPLPELDDGAD